MAVLQASEFLVPKEVRDHLDTLEKDWVDFNKKRAEVDKKQGRNVEAPDQSKVAEDGNGKPLTSASIWVPIPVWTTVKGAPEYKTTDPEWKEFLKLEQDRERMKKLKADIARAIATGVLDGLPPTIERAWGFDGKVSCDSGQIDFVFPFSPPNIYERPGLLITSGGIKWTSHQLPDERGRRFYRIFHPTVFAQAFWAGGKAFYKFYYKALKKRLSGVSTEKPSELQPRAVTRRIPSFTAAETSRLIKALTISTSSTPIDSEDSGELLRVLIPHPAPKSAMEAAVNAYKRKHTDVQVAKWKECPRGGCYLMGHVDVRGTKATIRVSVRATYIPSQDKFLGAPTIGEAIVMPNLSMMTADKLKKEKFITRDEKRRSDVKTSLSTRDVQAESVKQAQEVASRLARRPEFERNGSKHEKAKPESQGTAGTTTKESQERGEIARTESLESIREGEGEGEAKGETRREIEKSKPETPPDAKPKVDKVRLDAAKQNPGQGPPDEK